MRMVLRITRHRATPPRASDASPATNGAPLLRIGVPRETKRT